MHPFVVHAHPTVRQANQACLALTSNPRLPVTTLASSDWQFVNPNEDLAEQANSLLRQFVAANPNVGVHFCDPTSQDPLLRDSSLLASRLYDCVKTLIKNGLVGECAQLAKLDLHGQPGRPKQFALFKACPPAAALNTAEQNEAVTMIKNRSVGALTWIEEQTLAGCRQGLNSGL
ncbi:MAG TPA: hypothetical protein VFV57_06815 [Limnobacter sp.]|nr:hypothetical protein [Limnobacter sp.]